MRFSALDGPGGWPFRTVFTADYPVVGQQQRKDFFGHYIV